MDFGTSDMQAETSLADLPALLRNHAAHDDRNRPLKVMIAAAARGDVQAFEALYDNTAAWLLSRVRRITGESHAEDVLAEVFLQVWRSLPLYEESRGEPLAWLATIARSRALDKVRTERRSHGGTLEAPAASEIEETHDVGPEQLLAIAERARMVQLLVGALSAKEQLVLGMAYFRDCSQSEIASLTGLPLGTVKTLMTRAQQKLRTSMATALAAYRLPRHDAVAPTA